MKFLLCFAGMLGFAWASACLWDSDTLAMESDGNLDFVDATTGRFARNPPIYYEMRLARVESKLAASTLVLSAGVLAMYDDAGVACDRLGRHEEAADWMRKKFKLLKSFDQSDPKVRDHMYRYHANLGTFLIHGWFRRGALQSEVKVARDARDHIEMAIEINPDAHFGRERVQLLAMDWAIAVTEDPLSKTTEDTLASQMRKGSPKENEEMARGLAGLVVLGNAWESPDVFHALAQCLSMARHGSLARLAELRTRELLDEGKPTLSTQLVEMHKKGKIIYPGWSPTDVIERNVDLNYPRLRSAADQYHSERLRYLEERLRAGRHPDDDEGFWRDFKAPPRPEMVNPPLLRRWFDLQSPNPMGIQIAAALGALSLLLAIVLKIRNIRRRARAQ